MKSLNAIIERNEDAFYAYIKETYGVNKPNVQWKVYSSSYPPFDGFDAINFTDTTTGNLSSQISIDLIDFMAQTL